LRDSTGKTNDKGLLYAYLNSSYQTGFTNPIDEAIRTSQQFQLAEYKKLDEVPYDFVRKRLTTARIVTRAYETVSGHWMRRYTPSA